MRQWSERLGKLPGCVVSTTFDFPGVRKAEKLTGVYWAAARSMVEAAGQLDAVFFAGKSMGSRVGCIALGDGFWPDDVELSADGAPLLEGVPIRGVVAFGYPFRAPSGDERSAPLEGLPVPALLVSGDRDAMGPLGPMRASLGRSRRAPHSAVHVIEGAGHGMAVAKRVLKAAGQSQEDVDATTLDAVRAFIGRVGRGVTGGHADIAGRAAKRGRPDPSAAVPAAQRARGKDEEAGTAREGGGIPDGEGGSGSEAAPLAPVRSRAARAAARAAARG